MDYKLKRPCKHCPFRNDIAGYLRPGRADEIAKSIVTKGDFPCHQTTVTVEDEDGSSRVVTGDSLVCAGSLILQEKVESPGQLTRIAERLNVYDPAMLDMGSPVVDSLDEFVRVHGGREVETCQVVEAGCLAPAGFAVGGSAISNTDVDPADMLECRQCGEPVCSNCTTDAGDVCLNCEDDRDG